MSEINIPKETVAWLQAVAKDHIVKRVIGAAVTMELLVSEVDDDFIHCGPWKFDKTNGAEVDEDLGWDATNTGSFIVPPKFK